MRECRTSGSVRGVPSNGHPYRNLDQADLVRLACPVDAGEPFDIFCHHSLASFRRQATAMPNRSLYWRSWRDSPPDVHRGQPAEARVPVRCSKHGR